MKNTQFLLTTFMIIASFATYTPINASERKFISRQIQLGLMESLFSLAHAKDPVTQSNIDKEFTDRQLHMSDKERHKALRFTQALSSNKELSSCFMSCYAHVKQPQAKLDAQTQQCQNMVHTFLQAQTYAATHQSEK